MKTATLLLVLLSACPALVLAGEPPAAQCGLRRLRVRISRLPPTRVRCSLDAADGFHAEVEWDPNQPTSLVQHVIVDPCQEGKPVKVYASFWAEPVPLVPDLSRSRLQYLRFKRYDASAKHVVENENIEEEPIALDPVLGGGTVQVVGQVFSGDAPRPGAGGPGAGASTYRIYIEPAERASLHHEKARLAPASAEQSGGGRSLEATVPPGVNEVFQILAEIAFERARAKAFTVLEQRLERFVCQDLRWDADLVRKYLEQDGAPAAAGAAGELLLPRTCDVVKHLRIQELASSGKTIYQALLSDLAQVGAYVVLEQVAARLSLKLPRDTLRKAGNLAADLAAGKTTLQGREAQMLLLELGRPDWAGSLEEVLAGLGLTKEQQKELKPALLGILLGVDVTFAVIGSCHAKGGCDAREIAHLACHPELYFSAAPGHSFDDLPKPGTPDACFRDRVPGWPDLDLFISRGLDVIAPPKGATPRSVTRAAVNLIFDVVERTHWQIAEQKNRALPADRQRRPCGTQDPACLSLRDVRALLNGVLDQEAQPVVVAVAGFLQRAVDSVYRDPGAAPGRDERMVIALRKTTALLAAVTSYAATYSTDGKGDGKDAQAQHEARKKAIESLIDTATDRSRRDGDWVVSLGANVGFLLAGAQWAAARDQRTELSYAQLELPMGIALERLPNRQASRCPAPPGARPCRGSAGRWLANHTGFHAQLSVIDLAQFLAFDSNAHLTGVHWGNFVMVGAQLGLILGTPSTPFVLGVEGRWAPTLFRDADPGGASAGSDNQRGGLWRIGFFASYYVPFFDIN